MKRLYLFPIMLAVAFTTTMAQGGPSPEERQRWKSELRNYKHEFMAKDLDLTREQQNKFFPLYDQMEDSIERINIDTRELENSVANDATDIEVETVARALFEQKSREGKIELEYFDAFKEILTPRQMLNIKNTERNFMRRLMHHNRRLKNAEERKR